MSEHALQALCDKYKLADTKSAQATLAATIFPSYGNAATWQEVMALCVVALEYDLNPWTKQIYAFPVKGGGIQPIVGIDGWIKKANEHPAMDGCTVEFSGDIEDAAEGRGSMMCTVTVHRKDWEHPYVHTEFFEEAWKPPIKKRDGGVIYGPWHTSPRRMLLNRTQAQAYRRAFGLLPGAMIDDEAERLAPREAEVVDMMKPEQAPDALHDLMAADPAPAPQPEAADPEPFSGLPDELFDQGFPWFDAADALGPFESWCDNAVGGSGGHRDKTWAEMAAGAVGGGRCKYLDGSIARAEKQYAEDQSLPSSRAVMAWATRQQLK